MTVRENLHAALRRIRELIRQLQRLSRIDHKLDDILEKLGVLCRLDQRLATMEVQMGAILNKLGELQTDVANQRTVIDSAITAFQGLAALVQSLRDEIAALGGSPEILAKIDELKVGVESQASDLAAAIPQNTPAARK